MVKNLPANVGGSRVACWIPELGRCPGVGNGNPLFSPGKSHGQRSLAGYSPWGHKESDVAEHAHAHTPMHTHTHTRTHSHAHSHMHTHTERGNRIMRKYAGGECVKTMGKGLNSHRP